jgi:hypothetical protein
MISVTLDGNQWCALLGENIQVGLGGFGDTPAEALRRLADEIELYGWDF